MLNRYCSTPIYAVMKTSRNYFLVKELKTLIAVTLGFMLLIIPSVSSSVFAVDVAPAPPSIGAVIH